MTATTSAPKTAQPAQTSWDHIRWDFTDIYTNETDPQLQADVQTCLDKMAAFSKNFKGHLHTKLADALTALIEITQYEHKVIGYLHLIQTTRTDDEALRKIFSKAQETITSAQAKHLTFFDHEVNDLEEETYQNLLTSHPVITHHKPYLDQIRKYKPYYLAENVEEALAMRQPFGANAWSDFTEEMCAGLTFNIKGKDLSLEEALNITTTSKNKTERFEALKAVNAGLKPHTKLVARAFNVMMGQKQVEDTARGYTHPMHARNLDNQVDDATVEALHTAVQNVAGPLAQRYYKLKAKLLGLNQLHWADRNAPMPFSDEITIPWEEGFNTVKEAFKAFSPTLHESVLKLEQEKRIDAPVYKGKQGGAYCSGLILPNNTYFTVNFLTHLGTARDYTTLAHELGHAVHFELAMPAQGSLQYYPSMTCAETASIFAEMLTFERIKSHCTTPQQKATLLDSKCNDFINTVTRQISFSHVEQRMHSARKEGSLTGDDFTKIWMDVTTDFYGENGDVFEYSDMENLWCYISHFFSPFYVYAYAFGELFTQSLYAVKDDFGDEFEPMYLNMLRAGGTKDAAQLMQPFGLNPKDPSFWEKGIEGSLGAWLNELETLVEREINY